MLSFPYPSLEEASAPWQWLQKNPKSAKAAIARLGLFE